MILYEALTRRVPFEGESAVAVALKQVSQAPQRPSALNPAVSPAMDAVVMRALEKDPARRFHDADAFIAALQRRPARPGGGRRGDRFLRAAAPGGRAAARGAGAEGEKIARRRRRSDAAGAGS